MSNKKEKREKDGGREGGKYLPDPEGGENVISLSILYNHSNYRYERSR